MNHNSHSSRRKMRQLRLALFAIVFCATSTFALDCVHRSYGYDGTVCVCNATYCDNIAPLSKTPKGVITSYLTSLSGDRFYKSQFRFSSNTSTSDHEHQISINLEPNKTYQRIIGFGGAFTDSTGINIAHLPKEMQARLIKDYFADDGLEYTLGRIPIGGSDYSPRGYTYHEFPDDDNLTKFALQPEDLNYKIPFIHLAQQVSPHKIRLFGSPWSSPAWIKTNHEVNHGGFIIGKPGERYYKVFARYFVKFIEEYEKHKIAIWGITVDNEPSSGLGKYSDKYPINSLGMNGSVERDFVKLDLGPELHATGHESVKVMIYDDNSVTVMGKIEDFVSTVLSDKDAEKFVHGIAYHWYEASDRTELERIYRKYPNQFILGTEACELSPPKLGEWSIMEKYAQFIIRDLNHFSTGWTDWNMALDPLGRPHWDLPDDPRTSFNSPLIVNATSQEYYKQPHFYSMGHFSKFLQPDSIRIHHQLYYAKNETNIQVTTFQRPDKATVLVILNQNKHSVQLEVHDPLNGYAKVELKANALETLIWY